MIFILNIIIFEYLLFEYFFKSNILNINLNFI